jgi:hypothetical protein
MCFMLFYNSYPKIAWRGIFHYCNSTSRLDDVKDKKWNDLFFIFSAILQEYSIENVFFWVKILVFSYQESSSKFAYCSI